MFNFVCVSVSNGLLQGTVLLMDNKSESFSFDLY